MSLLVSFLINDAALKIADPNKTRVQLDEWTLIYNQSARELCQKANVLKLRAKFDLSTERFYPYPEELVQVSGLEVTETPTDESTYRVLGEKFEDEFRAETSGAYPSASVPSEYFADTDGFFLIPSPAAAVINGGRISYFAIPDRITDPLTATFQLPHFAQDYVIRRMVVHGLMARHRIEEANAELAQWNADVDTLQDKLIDRSDDRRSSLRPRRAPYSGMS